MAQVAYRISSEWDIGMRDKLFSTREKAMEALEKLEWEYLVEDTLENVMKDGYVTIKEIEID